MFESPTDRRHLRDHLRRLALQGGTSTYHDVARAIGLHPPHIIHSVSRLLEATMEEDARAGRPFIAALVTSRAREGLPARGFFETATRLGRFRGDPMDEAAAAFHAAELVLAQAYYARSA
jgi:hypothetical protein